MNDYTTELIDWPCPGLLVVYLRQGPSNTPTIHISRCIIKVPITLSNSFSSPNKFLGRAMLFGLSSSGGKFLEMYQICFRN